MVGPSGAFSDAAIRIGFGPGATAFGVLLGNIDAEPSSIFIVTLSTGDIYDISSNIFSPAFFGFVSTTPVSWIIITQLGQGGPGSWSMESPSVSTVPEPSSVILLGFGVLGIGVVHFTRWRRRSTPGRRFLFSPSAA